MNARAALSLLLAILLLAGCRGAGGTKPEPAGPGGPAAPPRPGEEAAPDTPAPPKNLLLEQERSQLYFDLDQYTKRYAEAREQGDSRMWTSLHASVLTPMVDKNLDELIRTLRSKDEGRYRIIAARGLGFGTDAARIVPELVAVLGEKNLYLVNSSLVSLYFVGSADTPLLPLVALLNHPDADVRSNDALALFSVLRARRENGRVPLSDEVREVAGRLIAAVSDPRDADVRGHAAAALGEIGDPAATDVLLNLLADVSSFVRTKAAEGLGQLGREEAIPSLIDALAAHGRGTEAQVTAAAIAKIARVGGFPCDAQVLGTDAEKWRSWYSAVKVER